MKVRVATLAIILSVAASACTRAPGRPTFKQRSGGLARSDTVKVKENANQTPGSGTKPAPVVEESNILSLPTEIALANAKFKGEEPKLEALVKYAGVTSAMLKLESSSDSATIKVPKLVAGKTDALVIEIYEGTTLRYKATKLATTFEKAKANSVTVEDCSIQKLPWTGEGSETLCGWSISDVKNQ
jgi:hypothetical protein